MHRPNPRLTRQHAVKTAVFSLAMAGSLHFLLPTASAGEGTLGLAEKEIQRRSTTVTTQQALMQEAETLLRNGDTAAALKIFETAFNAIPDVPLAAETRAVALDGYLRAGLARATELMNAGDYPAAVVILEKLDQPGVAQHDKRIAKVRQRLEDPDRYPPALTPGHIAKVAEVEKLLMLANSQREIGEYDKAILTYEEVLRLDAYNSAARRGLQKVEQNRAQYFEAAKDHTRSKMLNDVSGAWEKAVPPSGADLSNLFDGGRSGISATGALVGREAIQQKLRDLIINRIDFSGASIEEVVEYLRVRSRDLDPAGKGVDFVISVPPEQMTRPISLNLKLVPIEEVLRYVTEMVGLTYRVEEYAVRLISLTQDADLMISKSYRVPPDFISNAPVGGDAAGTTSPDPFASGTQATTAPGGLQVRRLGAQEFLQSYGVTFGEGASASFTPTTSMLIVRNTAKNMELVDMLVEQAQNRSPKQVIIDVKFLEVGDNRLSELGFDWLLGNFGISSQAAQLAGGTTGNAGAFQNGDFPFQTAAGPVGSNPVTAGLRSSGDLGLLGIDGVLFGTETTASRRSPGVLSLSGVLSSPQFQLVIRSLDQKSGIDMASQPSLVTRSGQKASLEIVRELIYPTEFDPPQIPTSVGNTNVVDAETGELIPMPLPPAVVTPSTPTSFEMRKTGIVLDIEPVIADDNRSVDLTMSPEFVEFSGFVNYGSPINTITDNEFYELTPNLIFQPVFDSRKVVTSVKVWDGATIVLGGLVTDREEVINDKVPFLGDMPVFGRLFRSNVKQRRMRHAVFFVTVHIVDPSGARVNQVQAK
ncbi:general secretion pathway protein D [Prosthecobacter fusiformis]|uniref:General secretion pathway protein D n=1 Tax=Prosthecobacter fusiformis TaxID=48464 RepID=A0A4R7SQ33_9BACT|nr:Amuc_1098 family type IV pilus outer membrane protein [Prosthecobacter fusiformis]TDU81044.1 general secretion pathway protein D [Prosthecobacter fusiformis]